MISRIQTREQLLATDDEGKRRVALDLLESGLEAVDADLITRRALERLAGEGASLDGAWLLAFGKAASKMTRAALTAFTPRAGLVITLEDARFPGLDVIRSTHPTPGAAAVEAGEAVLGLASKVREGDTVVVLVSGGGSAMMEQPRAGISVELLAELTEKLLKGGASIAELNAVRTSLSELKGGGLSDRFYPAKVVNVVISDVPGRAPSVIASGPTVPSSDAVDPWAVLEQRDLTGSLSADVEALLRAPPLVRKTNHIRTVVAADNRSAVSAMIARAEARGLRALEYPRVLKGEARDAGAHFVRAAARQPADVIVGGGETTVKVVGDGKGGRNHEFVLGAAMVVGDGVLASIGTDGIDGTSSSAGAMIDSAILERAQRKKLDVGDFLMRNDSHVFFATAGGSIVTGHTGTNVADICVFVR